MDGGLMAGVRVADLSRVLAGPYAAHVLADMGADVIKVEHPNGDPARGIGPHVSGRSLYFASLNSGKRGVVLDLSDSNGRRALDALLPSVDVVIENFRPDAAKALACDAQSLLNDHPHLTVVTVSGFAHQSPRASEPALDLTVQAESGIMSITGERGRPPVRAGVPVADLAAGLWAALGAAAGYGASVREGRGRHIEVPLMDSTLTMLCYMATAALAKGKNPPRVGSGHHSVAPYGAYPTSDGWVAVAVIGDKFWESLCDALAIRRDSSTRQHSETNRQRVAARKQIDAAVAQGMAQLSTDQALARLRRAGVPAAPVNGVVTALSSDYVTDRGIVSEISARPGSYQIVRGPLRTEASLRPAPSLGEHTREVFSPILIDSEDLLEELLARITSA